MEKDAFFGYYRFSKQSYADILKNNILKNNFTEEFLIGIYHKGGGTSGEFKIQWSDLAGKNTPQIQMFSDSWKLFKKIPELFKLFADLDSTDISPDELEICLSKINFKPIIN